MEHGDSDPLLGHRIQSECSCWLSPVRVLEICRKWKNETIAQTYATVGFGAEVIEQPTEL